jgi:hypothetical protein
MIQTGDIIFVRGNSIISKIIRFFDTGRFSHVCIAVSNTHILEAQYLNRVEIKPFYYGKKEIEIVDLGLNEDQKLKVISVGLSLTGTWYDYTQLFYYVFKKIFKLEGRNFLNNPNNLICSELINQILIKNGYIEKHEQVEDLTPNQLYNFLKNICKSESRNCKIKKLY